MHRALCTAREEMFAALLAITCIVNAGTSVNAIFIALLPFRAPHCCCCRLAD
jgi:hypothetical protein